MLSSLIMFIVTICFQKSAEKRYKVNFYNLRRNFIDIGLFIFVAENVFGMTKIISEWIFGERDKYFVKKTFLLLFYKIKLFFKCWNKQYDIEDHGSILFHNHYEQIWQNLPLWPF